MSKDYKKRNSIVPMLMAMFLLQSCKEVDAEGDSTEETDSSVAEQEKQSVDVLFPDYGECNYEFRDTVVPTFWESGGTTLLFCPKNGDNVEVGEKCCLLKNAKDDPINTDSSACKVSMTNYATDKEKYDAEGLVFRDCGKMCNNDAQCPGEQICADYMKGIAFCRDPLESDCTKDDVKKWHSHVESDQKGSILNLICNLNLSLCTHCSSMVAFMGYCNWQLTNSEGTQYSDWIAKYRDGSPIYEHGCFSCFSDSDCGGLDCASLNKCNTRVGNMKFCYKE